MSNRPPRKNRMPSIGRRRLPPAWVGVSVQAALNRPSFTNDLIPMWLPAIPGLTQRLAAGVNGRGAGPFGLVAGQHRDFAALVDQAGAEGRSSGRHYRLLL